MSDTKPTEPKPTHVCDTGNFDRTLCAEPCGSMHSYCDTCGKRQDPCAHEPTQTPVTASLTSAEQETLDDAMAGVIAAWTTGEQSPEAAATLYAAVGRIKADANTSPGSTEAIRGDERERLASLLDQADRDGYLWLDDEHERVPWAAVARWLRGLSPRQ